jgi:hypothetical protein
MEDKKECLGWLRDGDKCETSTSDLDGEDTASKIVNCDDNAESTDMLIQSPSGYKAMIYCKETLPQSLYKVSQCIYAKDNSTGLLCPAFIQKVMWGLKADKINAGFCLPLAFGNAGENDKDEEEEDKDAHRWGPKHNGLHYYMHFMGWAVKCDQSVQEEYLYEDLAFTVSLSKLLSREYNKVKPKKKGQKMSLLQIQV